MDTKKTNNILLLIAAIIITFTTFVMYFQSQTLEKYKSLLKEENDTIVETDTIYLDREIRDTVPTIKWEHIVKTDTLYAKDSTGNIVAQPMVVCLKKKSTKIQW